MSKEKRKEYNQRWKSKNKEKIKDFNRSYSLKHKDKIREYHIKNRTKRREHYLKKQYNISIEQYEEMLKQQNGVCAICGLPESKRMNNNSEIIVKLAVDHDHTTGQIRALLCSNCNLAVGHVMENPEIAEKLASYLRCYWVKGITS